MVHDVLLALVRYWPQSSVQVVDVVGVVEHGLVLEVVSEQMLVVSAPGDNVSVMVWVTTVTVALGIDSIPEVSETDEDSEGADVKVSTFVWLRVTSPVAT